MENAFDYLTDDDRALLEEKGEIIEVEKDHLILQAGERRRALYVILEGACRVVQSIKGNDETIAVLAQNEFFGDMNFLEGLGASANVLADEPTRLLIITPEETATLLAADPGLATRFYHSLAINLSRRLRATTTKLVEG